MLTALFGEKTKLMNSAATADTTYGSDESANVAAISSEDESHVSTSANESEVGSQSSMIPTDTIPIVLISILLGLVSGTLYGFGRYARALKEVLILSQSQVQFFGICLDCGNYIGHPVTGMIYDRHGPSISCLLAACIVTGSYLTIHFIMVHTTATMQSNVDDKEDDDSAMISALSITVLNIAFAGVGFGSGLSYIAGLGSTTKLFRLQHPKYLSRAIGFVAAGYGLSSVLVGLSYRWLHLGRFFLFWAITVPTVALGAAYMFRNHMETDLPSSSPNQEPTEVLEEPLLLAEPPTEVEIDTESIRTSTDSSGSDGTWESWKRVEFWLLFFAFACVTGCGLFVINNLSTMVQSSRQSDSFAFALVVTLSLANVLGRIVMGGLGDRGGGDEQEDGGRGKERKLRLMQMTHVIMTLAFFNVIVTGQGKICLILLVVIVALAYGGSWVAVISILSDLFGKEHFGKDYGLLAMGPALSGMALNNLSARLYDQQTSEDSNVCLGSHCYRTAYILAGIAALLGLASIEILIRKRRNAIAV